MGFSFGKGTADISLLLWHFTESSCVVPQQQTFRLLLYRLVRKSFHCRVGAGCFRIVQFTLRLSNSRTYNHWVQIKSSLHCISPQTGSLNILFFAVGAFSLRFPSFSFQKSTTLSFAAGERYTFIVFPSRPITVPICSGFFVITPCRISLSDSLPPAGARAFMAASDHTQGIFIPPGAQSCSNFFAVYRGQLLMPFFSLCELCVPAAHTVPVCGFQHIPLQQASLPHIFERLYSSRSPASSSRAKALFVFCSFVSESLLQFYTMAVVA